MPGILQESNICAPVAPQGALKSIQKKQILVSLGVDETLKWHNSFVLVPKANGKVWLCLDLVRPHKALTRPVHRGHTLNNIPSRLAGVKYFHSLMLVQAIIISNKMKSYYI